MSEARITSEAELIALLAPLTRGAPGALGLKDDCARLTPKSGCDLVLKTDPVRAGVHFFEDDPPTAIACKSLAVNVSDLVAKGAEPVAYLMALSFPEAPTHQWVAEFVRGLHEAQTEFGCHLIGGDTDRAGGPLSITVTVIGEVAAGRMVRRDTARAGDAVYVSGHLGDAALGLMLHREARDGRMALRNRWGLADSAAIELMKRYMRPTPRLSLSAIVRDHARASMDVSDGVVKDLERMCKASGVGADVDADRLPLSPVAAGVLQRETDLFARVVSAGDDYEILTAVAPDQCAAFEAASASAGTPVTLIGQFRAGDGVAVTRMDGTAVTFDRKGWDHF
jgi:thiamine-monophosphate kinase